MAATNRLVHLNVALEQAGLLSVAAGGVIDLASTRALAPPLTDGSVAVNLSDRKGGIVPFEDRDRVLSEIRRVFLELRDPTTGGRIVTAIYEPSASGLLQPGGETAGDLFLDFTTGYYPSTDVGGESVVTRTVPRGNHIFRPTRRDMLAICAAWGPRVPGGTNWDGCAPSMSSRRFWIYSSSVGTRPFPEEACFRNTVCCRRRVESLARRAGQSARGPTGVSRLRSRRNRQTYRGSPSYLNTNAAMPFDRWCVRDRTLFRASKWRK